MTKFDTLTKEVTIDINRKFNSAGMRSEADLDYILYHVCKTRGINQKAAIFLMEIARKHPFMDGNKRTAFEVMMTFLELNGKKLEVGDTSRFNVVVWSVKPKTTIDEIVMWIANHTRW
jgi:death-on-curing protein